MSEVQVLIDEAKQLLTDFEKRAREAASELEVEVEDVLGKIDHTQLRVAVHRLGLFGEHVERVITDFHVIAAPAAAPEADETPEADGDDDAGAESDEDLDALSRKDLNARAALSGVETPEKLPNKLAVIAAIREAEAK
jgi:hypothetical protein